jgi:hypothetical protein
MWEFFPIVTQFAINMQLKYLTHMFCPWFSSHKLYKKGVISSVLTLKYMCPYWMKAKKFNLKNKI